VLGGLVLQLGGLERALLHERGELGELARLRLERSEILIELRAERAVCAARALHAARASPGVRCMPRVPAIARRVPAVD
jgi:hypothetical protein